MEKSSLITNRPALVPIRFGTVIPTSLNNNTCTNNPISVLYYYNTYPLKLIIPIIYFQKKSDELKDKQPIVCTQVKELKDKQPIVCTQVKVKVNYTQNLLSKK